MRFGEGWARHRVLIAVAAAPMLMVTSFCARTSAQAPVVDPGRRDPAGAQPSPPPSASQDDVVESISPASADAEARPPEPPVAARAKSGDAESRTQVGGWARESAEWTFRPTDAGQGGAAGPYDVPHDRLISRTQVFVRASHEREGWFEATISGVLGYALREQGPSQPVAFNGVNGRTTAVDRQTELRELYIGLFSKRVDFRIGQQRVAWGRADLRSPNDVLNAFDARDPILTETELRHVPTPLLRADMDLGAVSVELVGTPVFTPDVYDVYGTNWAVIQGDAPAAIKGLFNSVSPLVDPTKRSELNALIHDTQLPDSNWTAPSAGAKLSATIAGVDVDAYYHYGFDTTPYVSADPSFAKLLGTLDFRAFRPSDLTPVLQSLDGGIQPFSARYVRRHHIGFDAVATAGPFVWRLDAAYETRRVHYHTNFTSFSSPAVMAVASIEYQTGDIDKVLLVEGNYEGIVDGLDAPLLGYNQHSFGVAGTLRWPLARAWALDLKGLAGVTPASFALRPLLRWKPNDSLLFAVGAVLLGGEGNSLGWYYRHNTSAFLQAKYSF